MAIYKLSETKNSVAFVVYDKSAVPGFVADAVGVKPTDTKSQGPAIDAILKQLQQYGLCKYDIDDYNRKTKGFFAGLAEVGDEAQKVSVYAKSRRGVQAVKLLISMMDNPEDIYTKAPKADDLMDGIEFHS